MSRREPSSKVSAEVLAANNHTCCICREQRKHVQLHHIDGNSSNSAANNLAVVCLDDHSRVTGNEGLGRRFSPEEVMIFKRRWEATCALPHLENQGGAEDDETDDEEPDEPVHSLFQTRLVRSKDDYAYEFPMECGQQLICSISSDVYIDVSICSAKDYRKWQGGADLMEYEGEEDIRQCDLPTFTAPHDGRFVVAITNDGDEDADVTVDIALWAAEEDEEEDA